MNIIEELGAAKVVGITGHIRPDGDCTGSVLGLYNYLKDNAPDIDVNVYLEQPSDKLSYLNGFDAIKNVIEPDKKFDAFIVLDCSSIDRIEPFADGFKNADKTICIDHHISNDSFADVNNVIPTASSACEVLYDTFDAGKVSRNTAECIYTGIIHDTGVFKYSCTSLHTMEIAGKMMQMGIDYSDIIDNSFYKKSYVQNQILGRALLESVLFYDGKCIFSSVTRDEMDFYGVTGRELGGIIEQLRLTDEVLYDTFDAGKVSRNTAECIYTGIIHDTGVFKYSCTSLHTMEIAGKMMQMGIDYSDIIDNSFYKKSYVQNQILGRALLESVLFYDGKCIFSSVTRDEMDFYGVTGRELGGIIEQLRLTDGVEVAIFLYETGDNEYKVSLRSKKEIDVSRIAACFGGGGHIRAAGFNAKGTVYEIVNRIGEMIEQQYAQE